MKVVEFLKKAAAISGFIKILDSEKTPASEHNHHPTKQIMLKDLIEEFNEKKHKHLSEIAPELSINFDQIFNALKIKPLNYGWNVDKVVSFLESENQQALKPDDLRKSLLEEFSKHKISTEDIIKDAIARDHALDSYEDFVYKKLKERICARKREIAALECQIKDCQDKINSLESLQVNDQEAFKQWVKIKVKKEEQLLKVASLITNESDLNGRSLIEEEMAKISKPAAEAQPKEL